jgi:hypothetical protein
MRLFVGWIIQTNRGKNCQDKEIASNALETMRHTAPICHISSVKASQESQGYEKFT